MIGDYTTVQLNGRWCYLYRAIDWEATFVDARLSETRDMEGAQPFFCQAVTTVGHCPARVRLMATIRISRRAGDAG